MHENVKEGNFRDNQIQESSDEKRRVRRQPGWMRDYVLELSILEEELEAYNLSTRVTSRDPTIFEEAVLSKKWREAMKVEREVIQHNNTWLPPGNKSIGVKWLYTTKYNEAGEVEKYKARLVAKGYA